MVLFKTLSCGERMGTDLITTQTIEVGRIYRSPMGSLVVVTKVRIGVYDDPTVEYYFLEEPQKATALRPYAFQRGFVEVQ